MPDRDDDKRYPRVLVISAAALNDNSASGITMSNLFKGWPLDCVAQVYGDHSNPKPEICTKTWLISHKDVPFVNAVRRVVNGLKLMTQSGFSTKSETPTIIRVKHITRRPVFTPSISSAWADIVRGRLSDDFWQWIDDYKPEVIYSLLGSIRIMRVALQVSNRLSIPIVPHFMDDWPTTLYNFSLAKLIPRKILLSMLNSVLMKSPYLMAICESMAEEYTIRYGLDFETFMNCVDIAETSQPLISAKENTITLVYIGGLHLNRWRSLLQLCDALLELKHDGYNVELVVFAPPADIASYGSLLSAKAVLRLGGSLSSKEILATLQQFDILVHIESFDAQDRMYTRLSISTKIPQYMASGRAILAYGPDEVASCRYVMKQNCGLVVGVEDKARLIVALNKLVTSAELRHHLGRQGYATALAKHNGYIERERFRNILLNAAQRPPT